MKRPRKIQSLLVVDEGSWRHPWHTRCRWSAERERWEAEIRPGLVNGDDAVITIPWDEAPKATQERVEKTSGEVDAWLSERPKLPITALRSIGGGAAPSGAGEGGQLQYEGVPEYFLARGVKSATPLSLDGEKEVVNLSQAQKGERRLRACELVLHLDRQSTSTQWTLGSGADGIFAQFSVTTFEKANARERGYIRAFAAWDPPRPGDPLELLKGQWEQSPTDEYRVATVYLLSPPDVSPDAEPDGSWTAHVKHALFWNLHYGTNRLEPPLGKVDLRLQTGLAGGVGDVVNQFLLAQINDANSAVSEFLGREQVEGRIWTA